MSHRNARTTVYARQLIVERYDLLHIDVKKLGRIPDGGGWRRLTT